MYELRVLSGLHRGATLPIDGRPHTLGADEDADVVLVDPGIVGQHASLALSGNSWTLSSVDGKVLDASSNKPHSFLELSPGEFARVGNVWLTVVEQDATWDNPPPEPDDDPEADAGGDTISVAELRAETKQDAAVTAQVEAPADAAVLAMERPVVVTKGAGKNGRRVVYISMAVATVLSAAAYAITSRPDTGEHKFDVRAQFEAMAKKEPHKGERLDAPLTETAGVSDDGNKKLSMEELRKAFRKRLSDADLMKRFDLDLGEREWSMKAALDDEEAARFERILASFVKAHNVSFPINAKVGSAESMLPFKIRQVTTGVNASIVAQDGTRIYIGEEYKGVKLASIDDNRVTFTGKRKIEVKW